MEAAKFECLPTQAFIKIGDFTRVRDASWRRYLKAAIRTHFPWYEVKNSKEGSEEGWRENDCIFTSLSEYLLDQFHMVVPRDSLFKVYNSSGEGLLIENMVDAISAVIEPLGFEIDLILASDPDLRLALNDPRAVGLECASSFHGRAGICMINIKNGYSHAFYWNKMNAANFLKEQFRLAVLVKKQEHFKKTIQ